MIRVLVIADSAIVQTGLTTLLNDSPALTVVGSLASAQPLAPAIADLQPDVLLLEWEATEEPLPLELTAGGSAFGALPGESNLPLVVLVDDLQGAWLSEAGTGNLRGVLPTGATTAEIIAAVIAAASGLVVLHPDALGSTGFGGLEALVPSLSTVRSLPTLVPQTLTPREITVLQMLAEGLGNKTIARRLSISEHTVKFHVSSIFTKLNASSRTEAVTLGARQGLILL